MSKYLKNKEVTYLLLHFVLFAKCSYATTDFHAISASADSEIRIRYESVSAQPDSSDMRDAVFTTRLNSKVKIAAKHLAFTLELADSRIFDYSENTPIGTDDVNVLEPIEESLTWSRFFLPLNTELVAKIGRFPMDIGTRRTVARNRFRNTVNTFDGAKIQLTLANWHTVMFYTFPVQRLPEVSSFTNLNTVKMDSSSSARKFFGVHTARSFEGLQTEAYFYKDTEADTKISRFTFGHASHIEWLDLLAFDYELIFQTGTTDLKRSIRAYFNHFAVTERKSKFKISAFLDIASGDDPSTDTVEAFNTLFGARRFEYGPTGIFGLFARQNTVSPGISSTIDVHNVKVTLQYRRFFLNKRGASGRLNFSDAHGGEKIADLIELRAKGELFNGLHYGAGYAFANLSRKLVNGDSALNYFYLQTTLMF